MGGITFNPESLGDSLSETAGYKSGLALSVTELCDHLSGTHFPDIILTSETHAVRLRAEEYDELFYKLLYRIGYTADEYNGDKTGARLFHKYKDTALTEWLGVAKLFGDILMKQMDDMVAKGTKSIDPTPLLKACFDKHGRIGLNMAMERLETMNLGVHLNPHSFHRYTVWTSPLKLSALFKGSSSEPEIGRFIDQRFINYLSQNQDRLPEMHWRKFEELAAEFYHSEGYQVQLGPGSNDDGVDVRVWKPGQATTENPHCLIQCKRQKAKVEKVVIKGLHADVSFEGAEYGLIVTTSELSPGAKKTITARGYPIREVNRASLSGWLERLRTPGTGIVRV